MNPKFFLGLSALLVGIGLNYLGDRLLGVRLEFYSGLATFSFAWVLDIVMVPFFAGFAVSWIYGRGGMWISIFPPLIVHSFSYFEAANVSGIPEGVILNSLSWWFVFIMMTMNIAVFGGIIGEVVKKRTYGRSSLITIKKSTPASSEARDT